MRKIWWISNSQCICHIRFPCICEYWQGKFWGMAHDSPKSPVSSPTKIFPCTLASYQLLNTMLKYKWYWIIVWTPWRYHKDITGSQFCCSSSSILDYTCSGQEQYGRWCEPSPQYPLMPVVHQSSTVAVQLGLYCWSVTTCGEWQKLTQYENAILQMQ